MAGGEPVHDAAHDRQDIVGLPGAVVVLDFVEQGGDVGSADVEEGPLVPARIDVRAQQTPHFVLRAQPLRVHVPFQPLLRHGFERLGLRRRRLERRQAVADAANGFARALPRVGDGEHVSGAERRPHLFAVRIEGDGNEGLHA
jgi:hypothetical protein